MIGTRPATPNAGCTISWLDRRRLGAAVAILLVFELALFGFFIAGTHGLVVPLGKPTTTDFVSFYAAGALADAGTPALAYDHTAHLRAEEQVVGQGIGYQFFNYPPVFLLLCVPLASLPYMAAFILFEAATLALYLAVAARILGDRSLIALATLVAFPIVFWNLGLGQNAFLTAGLFGAATALVDRRPVLAGLLFGALCYKPQFALLVPLALAAAGQWRAIAGAAAAMAALVLASLVLFGGDTWQAFIASAGAAPQMYGSGRILFAGMANVFGATLLAGGGPALAYALQGAASLIAAAAVVAVWRRGLGLSLPTRAAVLAAASLVAAPLALLYDLMLAAVAAIWLVRDRAAPFAAPWETAALTALFLAAGNGRWMAETWHVPAFPLIAIGMFCIAMARVRRELAQRRVGAGRACVGAAEWQQ